MQPGVEVHGVVKIAGESPGHQQRERVQANWGEHLLGCLNRSRKMHGQPLQGDVALQQGWTDTRGLVVDPAQVAQTRLNTDLLVGQNGKHATDAGEVFGNAVELVFGLSLGSQLFRFDLHKY